MKNIITLTMTLVITFGLSGCMMKRMMGYIKNQAKLKPDAYESAMIEHYYGVQ